MPFFQCLLLEFSCFYLGAQCEDGKEASAALSLASELMSRIETSGPDLPGTTQLRNDKPDFAALASS